MVLNLHGIHGKRKNTDYKLLCKVFNRDDIVSPQIDYLSRNVDQHVRDLCEIVDIKNVYGGESLDLVVGNSLGGFFALAIAKRYSAPCILVNPCLRPDISLKSLEPSYLTKYNIDAIHRIIKDNRNYDFHLCNMILGNSDEVLDSKLALDEAKGSSVYVVKGGHRLQNLEFSKIFSKVINILNL